MTNYCYDFRVCQDKCVSFFDFFGGRVNRPPFSYENQLQTYCSNSEEHISNACVINFRSMSFRTDVSCRLNLLAT